MASRLGTTPGLAFVGAVVRVEKLEGAGTEEESVRRVAYFFDQLSGRCLCRQDLSDPWWEEQLAKDDKRLGMPGGPGGPIGPGFAPGVRAVRSG